MRFSDDRMRCNLYGIRGIPLIRKSKKMAIAIAQIATPIHP